MQTLFADTFYWVALIHAKDQWHRQVRAFSTLIQDYSLITTDLVLVEDKGYSLTDCISMIVMKQRGIIEVLTHDKHFTQENFRILFQDSNFNNLT